MAYKDSDQIATDSSYALGEYSFRIERSSVPGSTNDKIEVICTDKDGKNARKSIQVPSSTQIESWYVEANETEASVYIQIKSQDEIDTGPVSVPFPYGSSSSQSDGNVTWVYTAPYVTLAYASNTTVYHIGASSSPGSVMHGVKTGDGGGTRDQPLTSRFTFNGKTVYYSYFVGASWNRHPTISPDCGQGSIVNLSSKNIASICWIMAYGEPDPDPAYYKSILVGRFAIDLKDAGGVGPGSDWTDPGDYDTDWEEGDPTHTLYVNVTGALSGRHNDPIEDPSYSYIPADKDTVKQYGCGGDGGHGGGGGGGASTVVIHKFATNQANSKEVTAIARRHGYGSGGGKGGKGGDGCILIYY